MQKENKVIIFVGMSGAGKSVCVEHLKKKSVPSVYFGEIVINEVLERKLELNENNQKTIREEIRDREGKGALALRILSQIEKYFEQGYRYVVVDGLYSWTEYKIFKESFEDRAIIIAVVEPRSIRHQRIANRAYRSFDEKEATQRDYDEIEGIEKGGPIANADYYLANHSNVADLTKDLDKLIKTLDIDLTQLI